MAHGGSSNAGRLKFKRVHWRMHIGSSMRLGEKVSQNRYEETETSDLPVDDRLRHAAEMAEGFAVKTRKCLDGKNVYGKDWYWLGKAQELLKAALSDLDNIQED